MGSSSAGNEVSSASKQNTLKKLPMGSSSAGNEVSSASKQNTLVK